MTLVYLALAWGGGIVLCHLLWSGGVLGCHTPGWPFASLGGAATLTLFALRRRSWPRLVVGLALMLVLGAWRYQAQPFAPCAAPGDLARLNGDDQHAVWATVEGVVVGYPDVRDVRTFYRVRAEKITIGQETRAVTGELLAQAPRFPEYGYGDRLLVTGQLQTPPILDDFDYQAYLARQGIHSLMRRVRVERVARGEGAAFWNALYGLRSRGSALLNRVLPEPAAALANGMTLGIESGIPPDVDEAFKATGTSHVIVISGSNIALFSGVLMGLASRVFGKRRAALPVIAVILAYVLLVGADSAALRAGIMGSLYVVALALGRGSTAFVSLFTASLIMTAVNPLALWDVGFQLSFMATLGLTLFAPTLQGRFERLLMRWLPRQQMKPVQGFLNDALILTLAAQVTTLPLIVHYFGRLSVVSLAANFLILPVQPPILMGGIATLAAGLIWEPLGRVAAVIPWLFLTYTTAVVRLAASVPFASVDTGWLGRALALVYYAILFGTLGVRHVADALWMPLPSRRALGWVAAAVIPLWLGLTTVNSLPDGRLHLFFVPGEAGEAALIVTPTGQRVWIWDGRGDGQELARGGQVALTGWHREVDMAIQPAGVEHGLPAAQKADPGLLQPGAAVRLAGDATLVRLNAGRDWAFRLEYGALRIVLPMTLRPEAQTALLASGDDPAVTLLKGAGPGTGAWPTAPFLAAAAPQTILWPQDTTYPPDVADLLTQAGARRIASDAVVEVVSDGRRLWVKQHSREGAR